MTANESKLLYCGSGFDDFHTSYKGWHGYISLIVCLLGTIANILNIIVLTRRDMRSPTNAILTGLAVADLAVMLEYIPYTTHDYILEESLPREQRLTYSWACFIKFHSIFTQLLHTISIWLTVTLAVWRYIAVAYPQKNRQWCGMRTTIITIATAYIVCILVVVPSLYLITSIVEYFETLDANGKPLSSTPLTQYMIDYERNFENKSLYSAALGQSQQNKSATADMILSSVNQSNTIKVETTTMNTTTKSSSLLSLTVSSSSSSSSSSSNKSLTFELTRNVTVYRLYLSDLALRNKSLQNTTQLIYSVLIKLIPCIALTILSIRLIMALLEAKRRRKKLTTSTVNGLKSVSNGKTQEQQQSNKRKGSKTFEKEKQTDRTTRMLLAVLLLFLITEFPQGILGLLNIVLGRKFLMQCYLRLSDLMDILALINSSINFILYCSMSRQFRTTFALLFRPKFLDKWVPVPAHEDETQAGVINRESISVLPNLKQSIRRTNRIRRDRCSRSMAFEQNAVTITQITNV
uniref:G-protein coupled receptors family 1 profile domain-containing protein n=1 Tax=Glossina brevipalpis TaxID=37001 RepID=A0A1A9X0D9_9MUSC